MKINYLHKIKLFYNNMDNLNFTFSSNWRKIDGYEHYLINRNGDILSFSTKKDGSVKIKQLKQNIHQNGYVMVCLREDKRTRVEQLGRLVLSTFSPVDDWENLDCDHIDNDPSNNKLENLQWLTHSENMLKRTDNGLTGNKRNHPIVIFFSDGTYKFYNSRKECCEELNVSNSTLNHLLYPEGKSKNIKKKYTGKSTRFGISACFFTDEIPDEWKEKIENEDKE